MKFQSTVDRFDPIPVKISRRSITVPDMSYTPREIIQKFSRGEKVPLGFLGKYDSEDSVLDGYDPEIFQDDPTRDPEFDFGDYVEEKHALQERERERKESAKRSHAKEVSSSKRKASDEELSVSDSTKRATTSGEPKTSANGQSSD